MSRLVKTQGPIAGVCGGIAENLNIDATLVRVGFVVASFFMGLPILLYIVLAIALPKEDGTAIIDSGESRRNPTRAKVANSAIFCSACGTENPAKSKFCKNCGAAL